MGARHLVHRSPSRPSSDLATVVATVAATLIAAVPTVAAVMTYAGEAGRQRAAGGAESSATALPAAPVAGADRPAPPGRGDARGLPGLRPRGGFAPAGQTAGPDGRDTGRAVAPVRVPEPRTALLLGLGLAGLAAVGTPRERARR